MVKEKCGLYGGIFPNISIEIRRGLFGLQHRGQESAGMSITNDKFRTLKGMGLVREALPTSKVERMKGHMGIGHVRYSTAGESEITNAQPIELTYMNSKVSIAHNGNLENSLKMMKKLESEGHIFLTNSDTEIFLHKLVKHFKSPPIEWDPYEMANEIFKIQGAYSLLFLFENKVVAMRDPYGYRPLWIRKEGSTTLFSSEDSAFPSRGDRFEMEPGSVAIATENGFEYKRLVKKRPRQCIFEYIYFARPDSILFGRNVHDIREKMGMRCAFENPAEADVVIPIMDSGFLAAIGFSKQSGIPLEPALVRNPWVGRTFIEPQKRAQAVSAKLSVIKEAVEGKRVVLIDDSIVRGTTSRKIVELVKAAKPAEVHFRVASPPVKNECFWGIDIASKDQLIGRYGIEYVKERLGVDSLGYLSVEGMCEVLGGCDSFCLHCFTGRRES